MNNQKKTNTNFNNLNNNLNINNNNNNLNNPSSQEKDLMRFGHTISLSKINNF